MQAIVTIVLWFAIVSVGLMAGVYFAFSTFIMQSLDALEKPAGMIAMQSINRVILRSAFLPLFVASTAACAVLAVLGALRWGEPGAWQMAGGGVLYVAGMWLVTMRGNVPLNNVLEATDAGGPDGPTQWQRYMDGWTRWNHVRTLSCTVSLALLVAALVARG